MQHTVILRTFALAFIIGCALTAATAGAANLVVGPGWSPWLVYQVAVGGYMVGLPLGVLILWT